MNKNNINQFGLTEYFRKQYENIEFEEGLIPARISAVYQGQYDVISEAGIASAKLKGTFIYNTHVDNYPIVGDFVLVKYHTFSECIIYQLLARKSELSRKAPNDNSRILQMICANVNYAFIVMSLNDDFSLARAERYLTAVYEGGITPVIVLSKEDLVSDASEYLSSIENIAFGVDILMCSVYNATGLENFNKYLQPNKTVVFIGSSGVGKSSLLNAIADKEIMKVNDIREDDGKGRHTTTNRELILLDNGAMIIDTPGMREFGLINADSGIDTAFEDIYQLSLECKFRDCTHNKEPQCAVKNAIETGGITKERLAQYNKLQRTNKHYKRKEFLKEKEKRNKEISVMAKRINNERKKEF